MRVCQSFCFAYILLLLRFCIHTPSKNNPNPITSTSLSSVGYTAVAAISHSSINLGLPSARSLRRRTSIVCLTAFTTIRLCLSVFRINCGLLHSKLSTPVPFRKRSIQFNLLEVGRENLWPEFEIIVDDESEYDTDIPEDNVANSLISRSKIDDTMSSVVDSFQGDDDKKSWAYFEERIANSPEQVLRYYRNTNAKPIGQFQVVSHQKLDIPNCSYCGGPRCCEFQILPQLLYYFGVDNEVDSLAWASIVVYTCEASCEAGLAYKDEYASIQLHSPSSTLQ